MSEDANLQLLREIYAEWGRGEFKRIDFFHPEVEFITSGIESRTHNGPESAAKGWFDFLSAWEDFRVEAREIVSGAGPNSYVVFVHLSGRGKESGVPAESESANVIRMQDGKIRRMELHWDRNAALEAVGMSPGGQGAT